MSGAIQALKMSVPKCCHATSCDKDGCKVGLQGLQSNRIIVDMDCKALKISNQQKRCDYLYVSENYTTQVVSIELKSGRVSSANNAVDQLQSGADKADNWLPVKLLQPVQFIAILAHGKGMHRKIRTNLRSLKVRFRGKSIQVALLNCGDPLRKILG